jgi:hypothetical protein
MKIFQSRNARVYLTGDVNGGYFEFDFGYFGSNLPDKIELSSDEIKINVVIPKSVTGKPTHTTVIKNRLEILC